jgi:hypothetical protein
MKDEDTRYRRREEDEDEDPDDDTEDAYDSGDDEDEDESEEGMTKALEFHERSARRLRKALGMPQVKAEPSARLSTEDLFKSIGDAINTNLASPLAARIEYIESRLEDLTKAVDDIADAVDESSDKTADVGQKIAKALEVSESQVLLIKALTDGNEHAAEHTPAMQDTTPSGVAANQLLERAGFNSPNAAGRAGRGESPSEVQRLMEKALPLVREGLAVPAMLDIQTSINAGRPLDPSVVASLRAQVAQGEKVLAQG